MDVVIFTTYTGPFPDRELRLVDLLAEHGVRCHLVRVLDAGRVNEVPPDGLTIVLPRDEGSPGGQAAHSRAFVSWVGDLRPAWVLSRGTKVALLHDLPRSPGLRRGAIVGGGHRDPRLGALDLVLAESHAQAGAVRRRHPGLPVAVLPKTVDARFFAAGRAERDLDVIGVGWQDTNKQYAALLPLLGVVPRMALVGAGPEHEALRAAAAPYPGVEVPGAIGRAEVADMLGRARILAHPARREGLPRVVCEAMAAGCVPVFRAGALTGEMLDPSNSVACTDDASLRDAVVALLHDPARLADLSARARATAGAEFSDEVLAALVPTLVRLLDAGRMRRAFVGWRSDRARRPSVPARAPVPAAERRPLAG